MTNNAKGPSAWLCAHACRISDYVNYVEGLEAVEDGAHECVENRLLLEKAWQIVANEFYDYKGRFSQAAWAGQLLHTLQACSSLSFAPDATLHHLEEAVHLA